METADDSKPETASKKRRWWVVGGGIVAAAFLGAFGTWLFTRVAPLLDRPFETAPLEVYVDYSPQDCRKFAVPKSILQDVPVVAVDGEVSFELARIDGEWVVEHGGLPADGRTIGLTLHGTGDEAVVIHAIDLIDFEPIQVGEDIVLIHECLPVGGEMDVTSLSADFGVTPPVLEITDPELRFPYQVARADPEAFDVRISKSGSDQVCFCRWNIGITWSAGDASGQLVVEGESVGIATAIASTEWPAYWFVDGEWTTDPYSAR